MTCENVAPEPTGESAGRKGPAHGGQTIDADAA